MTFALHVLKDPSSFVSKGSPHGLFVVGANSNCRSCCCRSRFLLFFCFFTRLGINGGTKSVSVSIVSIIVGRVVSRRQVVCRHQDSLRYLFSWLVELVYFVL